MCRDIADLLPLANSGELTAAEEQQVNAHVQTCSSCRAEVERYQQVPLLLSKLNNPATATASQAVNPLTATPAALSPRPARRLIGAGPRAWALASAVVVLIAAVGVFTLTQQAKPATAAEIMARLAKGPAYTSFHGVQQVHERTDANTSWVDGTSENWYKAPDLFYSKFTLAQDGKPVNGFEGSDGTIWYFYDQYYTDSGKPEVQWKDAACLTSTPWAASDAQSIATGAWYGKYFDYTLVETEDVNGRPAYVLDFVQKPDLNPNDSRGVPGVTYRMKVWIDQQDGFIVHDQLWDVADNLLAEVSYLSFEFNPTLDSSLFANITPDGATIVDKRGRCDQ